MLAWHLGNVDHALYVKYFFQISQVGARQCRIFDSMGGQAKKDRIPVWQVTDKDDGDDKDGF